MLAQGFGLPNHAASMEYCFNSKEKGRVHFHAFVGPQVSFWGWQLSHRRVTVLRSHLMFEGLFPNVQVMKPQGRHGVSVCACHGMYYCLGPKLGQVFSYGTAKPFEDCWTCILCCVLASVTNAYTTISHCCQVSFCVCGCVIPQPSGSPSSVTIIFSHASKCQSTVRDLCLLLQHLV